MRDAQDALILAQKERREKRDIEPAAGALVQNADTG